MRFWNEKKPVSLFSLCLALCLLTGVFRTAETLRGSLLNKTFVRFHNLQWKENSGCRELLRDAHSFRTIRRTVTWGVDSGTSVSCRSQVFFPEHPYLELEVAGYGPAHEKGSTSVVVETASGRTLKKILPRAEQNSGVWKLSSLILETSDMKEGVRIHIFDEADSSSWTALRNKVNEYDTSRLQYRLRRLLRNSMPAHALRLLSALSMSLLVLAILRLPGSGGSLFFYLIPFAWHAGSRAYFFGDDFMYFEQFKEGWIPTLLYRHNEHILPVFSSLLKTQFSIFGDWYTAYAYLSLLLLGGVSHLLFHVLREIGTHSNVQSGVALLVCMLFLLSGLHTETLQWITCQSTLFSLIFRLACYSSILSYLKSREKKHLVLAGLSAVSAPLCFAGAFTLPFEIIALMYVVKNRGSNVKGRSIALSFGVVCLAMVAAALPYLILMNMPGTGLRLAQASTPGFFLSLRYTLFGSYFGTLLRGLGVIPIVTISEGYHLLPTLASIMGSFDRLGSLLGLLITLLAYISCAKRLKEHGLTRFFLFAQLLLLLPFIISSIGRTRFGVDYALQMRFHSVSLLGLTFALYCIFNCARLLERKDWIVYALLSAHLFAQQQLMDGMQFFTQRGPRMKSFVEQIEHWESLMSRASRDPENDARNVGIGTPYVGLYPLYYGGNPLSPSAQPPEPERAEVTGIFGYTTSSTQ